MSRKVMVNHIPHPTTRKSLGLLFGTIWYNDHSLQNMKYVKAVPWCPEYVCKFWLIIMVPDFNMNCISLFQERLLVKSLACFFRQIWRITPILIIINPNKTYYVNLQWCHSQLGWLVRIQFFFLVVSIFLIFKKKFRSSLFFFIFF